MEHSTYKMGKTMTLLSWLILLILMTYLFESHFSQQENPNQLIETYQDKQSQEIILQRNRQGHYVANGKINGHTVTFILDTGATDISIPWKVAKKIGIKKGNAEKTMTANGAITVYRARLATVSLGEILLRDVPAHVNPNNSNPFVLLGMSFLKQLEFSQRGDKLIIKQHFF